jgi:hypothetical protein
MVLSGRRSTRPAGHANTLTRAQQVAKVDARVDDFVALGAHRAAA